MAHDGEPTVYIGDYRRLGPDPEPLGERFGELMRRETAKRHAATPRSCPLECAVGRTRECTAAACVFFRVPGVDGACAPLEWSPGVAGNEILASWYLARRVEAAAVRAR